MCFGWDRLICWRFGWRFAFLCQVPFFALVMIAVTNILRYVTPVSISPFSCRYRGYVLQGQGQSAKEVLSRIDFGGLFALFLTVGHRVRFIHGYVTYFALDWVDTYLAQHEIQRRSSCESFSMSSPIPRLYDPWQWTDQRVTIPLALSFLALGLLLAIEFCIAPEPILPASLLREKVPVIVSLSNYFLAVCNFSIMYFIPLWFQTVSLNSASTAGMLTATHINV